MSKQLKRALHDLTNTMQIILSAIEEGEFQLALKATRRGIAQMESVRELIGVMQADAEKRD